MASLLKMANLIKALSREKLVVVLTLGAVLAAAAVFALRLTGPIIHGDGEGYYVYLPSLFIHGELHNDRYLADEAAAYDLNEISVFGQVQNESGNYYTKYAIGTAYLQLPFFLAGDFLTGLVGLERNGFGPIYQLSIGLSVAVYFGLALLLLSRLLRKFFDGRIADLALVGIVFGTNLFHYATYDGSFSHVYSFFLMSLFLYLLYRLWMGKGGAGWPYLMIGLSAGAIIAARPTNIVFPGLLLLALVLKELRSSGIRRSIAINYLLVFLGTLLPLIPQMLYWYANTGSLLTFSYQGEYFDFSQPHLLEVVFGLQRGMLFWSPVALLALAFGLWNVLKQKAGKAEEFIAWLVPPVLLAFILNLYVTSSWWMWWYGGSFGYRPVTESFAFLVFPLAFFINKLSRRTAFWVIGLLCLTTSILMLLYWLGYIPSEGIQL